MSVLPLLVHLGSLRLPPTVGSFPSLGAMADPEVVRADYRRKLLQHKELDSRLKTGHYSVVTLVSCFGCCGFACLIGGLGFCDWVWDARMVVAWLGDGFRVMPRWRF